MRPDIVLKIKDEVKKQFDVGFLQEVKYSEWVANIVPVPNKDGKVMPFGLKNSGATYQSAMVTLFHDMMYKEIEVYVDDMIAKSRTEKEHIEVLKKLFLRLRKFQLKLNPAKCIFGVRSGKLLGFMSTALNGRMARWKILLSEFDIVYVSQKAIKGSAIAEFLASRALEDYEPLNFDFPNGELMYVATIEERP
ncbi:uncharacterized protein K02A2.6-like [Gossypium hirsutum]|uniref:Uncharacterized protein K02A2.6-like n=1 Tax=Gossypium hirsutum TaxID=3635 RepID=A0A1U8L359_GOSHI|nr:uncharacterized protein K02A2.6-like [Gossypium hirsutum]